MAGWSGIKPTAFIKTVEADLKDKRNQVAAEALRVVVNSSPVDTGAFRGSHVVSIDAEDRSIPDRLDPSGQEAISAGMAVIDKADRPYQAVIVQTGISYGEALENGHSQQAPQGVYGPAYESIRSKYAK